jgi:hypothetical protein
MNYTDALKEKSLKLSEVIEQLTEYKELYGDLPVLVEFQENDYDYPVAALVANDKYASLSIDDFLSLTADDLYSCLTFKREGQA